MTRKPTIIVACALAVAGLYLFGSDSDDSEQTDLGSSSLLSVTNNCEETIWIQSQNGSTSSPLGDGIVKIAAGDTYVYNDIPTGWTGNFWPKTGCDRHGQNCETGQSQSPCPTGGCQPPAATLVEFNFQAVGPYYDISLVNGYTIPVQIVPHTAGGEPSDSCVVTSCALELDDCPKNEIKNLGNLGYPASDPVMCLSPCQKDTYPAPYGQGHSNLANPGKLLCCPTPPVTVDECREGPVVDSKFVSLVHEECPTAYAYAYDDINGNHNCPAKTTFQVNFCLEDD